MKNTYTTPNNQRGFSLIELMVALVLGSFVILGAAQVFISNQASFRLIDGLARTQENGRFALELMSHDLRMAGYPSDSFAGVSILGAPGGQLDQFTVQFELDADGTDCAGNAVVAGANLTNTYSINDNNLVCTGIVAGVNEVIVEGVEKMQLIYGEDTDALPDAIPNRYVNATQLNADPATAAARWNRVTTVRINLLVNSVNPALEEAQTYFYDGVDTLADDLLYRQEYISTVTLRGQTL